RAQCGPDLRPGNCRRFLRQCHMPEVRADFWAQINAETRAKLAKVYPVVFDPNTTFAARVIQESRVLDCADTEAQDVLPILKEAGRAGSYRSFVLIPLVLEGKGIGALGMTHPSPGHKLAPKQ